MVLRLWCCRSTLWLQWIGGVAAMAMMFVIGLSVGWSSPYLAQFASGDSPFSVTADEISWMASLYQLGRLPGVILGAVCVQLIGSKTAMIVNCCGMIIAWILVTVANSASWLYAARFISGVSIELANICFPLYLGDISNSTIRGALVAFTVNGMVIGILVGNAMGPYISMQLFACITLVPNICSFLIFLWLPHSPYYLVSKGRMKDAEKSIFKYNPKADVLLEVDSVKEFVTTMNSITFFDQLREFNIPRNRKAGIIVIVACMFTQCSGCNAVAAYMESIMTRAMVTAVSPSTVPIMANGAGIIAGWLTMYLTERFGRRTMWIVSSAGVCVTMLALGTHFYLLGESYDPVAMQWLPIVCMLSFKIFYNIGVSCIPAILLSELFASNIRTLAACFASASTATFAFVSIYGYQILLEYINEAYVWWIHAIIMAAALVFGLVLIPDMKGKTLLEIQQILEKN